MNKKPPELPNIEDATLRACLAPLMDAMTAGAEAPIQALLTGVRGQNVPELPAGSNDNPLPSGEFVVPRDRECADPPRTLAEWRSLADDDFGTFRMIELFLAMTEAELEKAAAEFPRQIGGTVVRLSRMKRRLADQYDTVTTITALLKRALARAALAEK